MNLESYFQVLLLPHKFAWFFDPPCLKMQKYVTGDDVRAMLALLSLATSGWFSP